MRNGAKLDLEALRWSASIHDIGKEQNIADWDHGKRSAELFDKNQNINNLTPKSSVEAIRYSIHWHDVDDEEVPKITPELAILKDADGLDLVRMRFVGWQVTLLPEIFRHDETRLFLMKITKPFFELSVAEFTNGSKNRFESVMNAGIKLGIIKNE